MAAPAAGGCNALCVAGGGVALPVRGRGLLQSKNAVGSCCGPSARIVICVACIACRSAIFWHFVYNEARFANSFQKQVK